MKYLLVAIVFLTGCSSQMATRDKGTLLGGSIGTIAGGIIASQSGRTGWGAAIGGVAGSLIGREVGYQQELTERQRYYYERHGNYRY